MVREVGLHRGSSSSSSSLLIQLHFWKPQDLADSKDYEYEESKNVRFQWWWNRKDRREAT